MFGLLIGAAILGLIIAGMEENGFPGWLPMILCVLAAVVPASLVNAVLPPGLFFIGLAVGVYLDRRWGTSPWLTIVFLILGIAAGYRNIGLAIKKSRKL